MTFYNSGLERAVLATAFFSGDLEIFDKLDNSCFYLPDHQRIRRMLKEIQKSGLAIDYNLLDSNILAKHEISEVSMIEVQATNPIQLNEHSVNLLKELSAKRRVHAKLAEMMSSLNNRTSIDVARMLGETSEVLTKEFFSDEKPFEMISIDDINEPPVQFACQNFLPMPRQAVVIMAGRGGVGKSSIALQSAIRHIKDTGEKVFCWFSEDPLGETKNRAQKLCEEIGIQFETLRDKLVVSNAKPFNVAINIDGNIITNPDMTRLREATKDFPMVIIDPLRSFASNFDENSNSDMDNVTKEFASWAKKENKIIVLIHHASKDGDIRGASSIVDAVRLAYTVRPAEHEGSRWVEVTKDNFGVTKLLGGNRIKVTTLKE